MKVYIVQMDDYDWDEVFGVFASEEKAKNSLRSIAEELQQRRYWWMQSGIETKIKQLEHMLIIEEHEVV